MHAIALKGVVNQMALCVDLTKLQGTIAKDVDTWNAPHMVLREIGDENVKNEYPPIGFWQCSGNFEIIFLHILE